MSSSSRPGDAQARIWAFPPSNLHGGIPRLLAGFRIVGRLALEPSHLDLAQVAYLKAVRRRGIGPKPNKSACPSTAPPIDVFAVCAAGDSMHGGKTPIADGDWLVMKWARGASLGSLEGRVALLQTRTGTTPSPTK